MSNYIETAFMQQRTDFMKTLPDRRKRFSIPDGVDMYLDIEYVNDQNEAHRLDVFRPSESPDKELPIIFNVHGGGLIMGCKEFNRYFCARLCKLGYVVFSIEYRLVPEYTFYHQCTDFFQALRYVQDYGNLYYGKTDEIYGVGDSGGAMLLTYCAAMQNNAEMAAAAQVSVCPAPLQALGLISGMFYTNRFDQIGHTACLTFQKTNNLHTLLVYLNLSCRKARRRFRQLQSILPKYMSSESQNNNI